MNFSPRPYAALFSPPPSAIQLNDEFWAPRRQALIHTTLPSQFEEILKTGRLRNFQRAANKAPSSFEGYYFNDSDVYKWLEAAAWMLAESHDAKLSEMVETVIDAISAAQQPDGYLNTYFMFEKAKDRWSNLRDTHELYCAGHFFQAAAAMQRALADDRMTLVARRLADLIYETFGPGKRAGTPGHPEVELALVDLYRLTNSDQYLELAQIFIDQRGKGLIGGSPYHQDHLPLRQMVQLAGHAVRALYLCAGATDLYAETGDTDLYQALERLWGNMTSSQLYITGGIGSRHEGEAFGDPYELPNQRAYTETCAAIASLMWNQRMLHLHADVRYADLLEWTLYNAILPGLSLDGKAYFYVNPLASTGNHQRQPWFSCACCPPNIARTLATLPSLIYSISERGIWVNLYAANQANLILPDNRIIKIDQITDYPWSGHIEIVVQTDGEFSLHIRLPGWATRIDQLSVNGMQVSEELKTGTYHEIHRDWQAGDTIIIDFPMPARFLESHPRLLENVGRVALARGPLLYCLESTDNPDLDLRDASIITQMIQDQWQPALLNGVVSLHCQGENRSPSPDWEHNLYRVFRQERITRQPTSLMAIPYYAWNNRALGQMQIWLKNLFSKKV